MRTRKSPALTAASKRAFGEIARNPRSSANSAVNAPVSEVAVLDVCASPIALKLTKQTILSNVLKGPRSTVWHALIVVVIPIGRNRGMSAVGRFLPVQSLSPDRELPGQSVPMKSDTFSRIDILTVLSVHYLLGFLR